MSFPESETRRGRVIDDGNTSPTLDTGCEVGVVKTVNIRRPDGTETYQQDRVYDPTGISPALCKYKSDLNVLQIGNVYGTEREPNPSGGRVFSPDGLMRTLGGGHGMSQPMIGVLLDDGRLIRIRKLTPKECFRLQGWTDDYFEKAAFVNSDSQLYKQAGNGVTVNVIYAIAKRFEEGETK